MRRIATLATLFVAALSRAELYGVSLVSWTPHPYKEGTGYLAYAGGVTGSGLIASQQDYVQVTYSPPPDRGTPPPYATQYGIAQISVDVSLHVYWLGDLPPSLYLNLWEAGDALATASRGTPGGTVMNASASAPPVNASVSDPNPRPYSYSGTSHFSGWRKSSSPITVGWTLVGYLGTRPLYRTTNPVGVQLGQVSATGRASTADGPCSSMSVGAGGFGYFVADHPWP